MQPEKPSYMSVLLREHLTVAISAFLVTFAAIKIIIFSLGNLSIALAVLNAGQQFTILASTMFSALVVGAVLLILIPTMVPIVSTLSEKERHRILNIYIRRYVPLFFAWALILIAAPAYYIAFIIIMIIWVRVVRHRERKKKRSRPPKARRRRLAKLAIVLFSANSVLLVISLAAAPWTPQENVIFSEEGTEVRASGYIIGQQGKQLLLVEADKSSVRWIGEDAIVSRKVCLVSNGAAVASKPVLALVGATFGLKDAAEECLSASKFILLT